MQRFEGRSVEDALAAAARQLGDGLQVRSAQRIRRGGLLGFFAKEHYEVTAEASEPALRLPTMAAATPAPMSSAEGNVDRVLRSLVQEVEARETIPQLRATPPRFTDIDLVPLETAEAPGASPAAEIPATAAAPVPVRPLRASNRTPADGDEVDGTIDLTTDRTPTFYDFEVLDAQEIERLPKWTRKALRDIGLPPALLNALPQKAPVGDMAWTRALERAISKVVPPPASLDGEHDAQVSGLGGKGAVKVIRAAVSGFTPGLLQIDGRWVPATATELALAVRSCLPR